MISFGWQALPRRVVITGIPAAVASAAVLASAGCTSTSSPTGPTRPTDATGATGPGPGLRFFSTHQAAVVEDATARIAPGPKDDPAEAGHPGAREAGVTGYIDSMLGALTVIEAAGTSAATGTSGATGTSSTSAATATSAATGTSGGTGTPVPLIFAGGPWSNRHTSGPDFMASFIPLDPVRAIAWRQRLAGWQEQYTSGIAALDKLAGGDFTTAAPADQDKILARSEMSTFLSLLFEHTIEGMYSVPEYGGNRGLVGWKDISYPGDSQPVGYTSEQVERSDGRDPVADTSIVADVLKLLGEL